MIALVLTIIGVCWFITQLQYFVEIFNDILKKPIRVFKHLLTALSCLKCVSFWFTLIYTQDFYLACQMSLLGHLIDNHLLTIKL